MFNFSLAKWSSSARCSLMSFGELGHWAGGTDIILKAFSPGRTELEPESGSFIVSSTLVTMRLLIISLSGYDVICCQAIEYRPGATEQERLIAGS